MKTENPQSSAEFTLFDGMAARVRAGEPIHVLSPCAESLGRVLLAQIERLKAETGKPVHIIFS